MSQPFQMDCSTVELNAILIILDWISIPSDNSCFQRSSLFLLCPISCAAGVSMCPAAVPGLFHHLEKLLAASSLPRLSAAHGLTPRWQEIQDLLVDYGDF